MLVEWNLKLVKFFLPLLEKKVEILPFLSYDQGIDGIDFQPLPFILVLQFLVGEISQIKVESDFLDILSKVFTLEQKGLFCLEVEDSDDSPQYMVAVQVCRIHSL